MAAYLLSVVGDQTTALSALDRAIALNPNSAHAWGTKALCQSLRGAAHAVVAVEAGNRAIRLSPLDPLCYIYKFSVALAYLGARQYQDAEVWIDDALREPPRFHAAPCDEIQELTVADSFISAQRQIWALRLFATVWPPGCLPSFRPMVSFF